MYSSFFFFLIILFSFFILSNSFLGLPQYKLSLKKFFPSSTTSTSFSSTSSLYSTIKSFSPLTYTDPEISHLISKEWQRQYEGINLIASENFASSSVLEALGSGLTNKYSEGRPGRRYYGGNEVIDEIERLCEDRALKIFNLTSSSPPTTLNSSTPTFSYNWSVNVQSYSGSPANNAILSGLLSNNDTILSLDLFSGGHLSHGYSPSSSLASLYNYNQYLSDNNMINSFNSTTIKFNSNSSLSSSIKSSPTLSSRLFNVINYHISPETEDINYNEINEILSQNDVKLLIFGGSACPKDINREEILKIKEKFGSSLIILSDISHTSGFISKNFLANVFEFSDVVMTTGHKTLRGPRCGLIYFKNWLKSKIERGIFPG